MNKRVFLLAPLAAALCGLCLLHFERATPPSNSGAFRAGLRERPSVPAIVRSLRPNYPYSVIPGGAYNRSELENWVRRDPVIRQHYSDFNSVKLRLVAAEVDRKAYVSYRVNDQVFWTKRPLKIPKGELLLTDGQNFARARCGNRVAERAPEQTVASSSEPAALDLPNFSMDLFRHGKVGSASFPVPPDLPMETAVLANSIPLGPLSQPPAPPAAGFWLPPIPIEGIPPAEVAPPAVYVPPGTPMSPTPPVLAEVPEPANLAALGTMLVGIAFLLRNMRRILCRVPVTALVQPGARH